MEIITLDWILEQSGLTLFAALALFLWWHSHRDGLRRERENSDLHRTDKERMTDALMEASRTNTQLCQLIGELRDDLKERR